MQNENDLTLGATLHQLSAMIDRRSDLMLQQRFKIGLSQLKVLNTLQRYDGITQRDIADFLNQTEASVSRQIKLLSSRSLISVIHDPHNRRRRIVRLTSKGGNVAESAVQALESLHAPMFLRLTEAEERSLKRALDIMYGYIASLESR